MVIISKTNTVYNNCIPMYVRANIPDCSIVLHYDAFIIIFSNKSNRYYIIEKGGFIRELELVKSVHYEDYKELKTVDLLNLCDDFYDISGENNDGTYMFFKYIE